MSPLLQYLLLCTITPWSATSQTGSIEINMSCYTGEEKRGNTTKKKKRRAKAKRGGPDFPGIRHGCVQIEWSLTHGVWFPPFLNSIPLEGCNKQRDSTQKDTHKVAWLGVPNPPA
ncbi:hypothetical protein BGZ63DRAFT_385301 [Mariannaea sp. PMI_226]|nr:hypothetical protein BGZ63DRAFT_385301 [Mariannaea sp. PMI_226]